jgi:hypothetical protein
MVGDARFEITTELDYTQTNFGFSKSIQKMVGDARFELTTELDDTQTNFGFSKSV